MTCLSVNEERLEVVSETKLLGRILTSDLIPEPWYRKLGKECNLLNRSASFTANIQDFKNIYLGYIRSILEQSTVVWHSSLTSKNIRDLECFICYRITFPLRFKQNKALIFLFL